MTEHNHSEFVPGCFRCDISSAETAHSFASIAAYDWVITYAGNVLHQLEALDDPAKVEDQWGGAGRTTCGLWSEWLSIPGVFSRMGAQRCKRCCSRANFPQGVGSPKNDPALRAQVGLAS